MYPVIGQGEIPGRDRINLCAGVGLKKDSLMPKYYFLLKRLTSFLNPLQDNHDTGFQLPVPISKILEHSPESTAARSASQNSAARQRPATAQNTEARTTNLHAPAPGHQRHKPFSHTNFFRFTGRQCKGEHPAGQLILIRPFFQWSDSPSH